MAKWCPEKQDYALYLECVECDTKSCKIVKNNMKNMLTNSSFPDIIDYIQMKKDIAGDE